MLYPRVELHAVHTCSLEKHDFGQPTFLSFPSDRIL